MIEDLPDYDAFLESFSPLLWNLAFFTLTIALASMAVDLSPVLVFKRALKIANVPYTALLDSKLIFSIIAPMLRIIEGFRSSKNTNKVNDRINDDTTADTSTTFRETEDMVELAALTIQDLRIDSDLSLAYRRIDYIPQPFAKSTGYNTISKVDLTECGIR